MNILFGGFLVLFAAALAVISLGIGSDWWKESSDRMDHLVLAMLGIICLIAVFFVGGLGIAIMAGADTGPTVMEGSCYRAVGKNTYMPMVVGKSTIIVPMHNVDLVEINCP